MSTRHRKLYVVIETWKGLSNAKYLMALVSETRITMVDKLDYKNTCKSTEVQKMTQKSRDSTIAEARARDENIDKYSKFHMLEIRVIFAKVKR